MIHRGGRRVHKGNYWSVVDGSVVQMNEGGVLPGGRKIIYLRRPPGGAYLVIPMVILLVALALPLASTMGYMIAWIAPLVLIIAGALIICANLIYYAIGSASEGWEPLKSYFTGKKKKKK